MQLLDIDRDEVKIITNVSWEEYEYCLKHRKSKARISYLDRVIQFMSPGYNHEKTKETISILIIAYCEHFNFEYFLMGSIALKQQDKSAGKEPDTSYSFGKQKIVPDLAVEVVYASGNIDSDLEKYRRLQVKEVWFWIDNNLEAYTLVGNKFTKLENYSYILPRLKLKLIAKYITKSI